MRRVLFCTQGLTIRGWAGSLPEAAVRATQTAHDRAKRQSKTHPDLVTLALADVTEVCHCLVTDL